MELSNYMHACDNGYTVYYYTHLNKYDDHVHIAGNFASMRLHEFTVKIYTPQLLYKRRYGDFIGSLMHLTLKILKIESIS